MCIWVFTSTSQCNVNVAIDINVSFVSQLTIAGMATENVEACPVLLLAALYQQFVSNWLMYMAHIYHGHFSITQDLGGQQETTIASSEPSQVDCMAVTCEAYKRQHLRLIVDRKLLFADTKVTGFTPSH